MRRPIPLLITVGLLLAINISLAKAAHDAGASAVLTALVSTAGAGVILLVLAVATGHSFVLAPRRLFFYAVAGGVSYALPNLLVFAAAGRVGPAFAALLHALVPGLTYLVAIGWGMDRLLPRRAIGLLLGLVGATGVIVARLGFSNEAEAATLLLALLAPVSIAFGNVIRSRYWPRDAGPLDIAPGMLLLAAVELGLLLLARPEARAVPGAALPVLASLAAVSAIFYALYFRLQHIAGPVYLSQIGYVATAFALPMAVLIFGDHVTTGMVAGAALVIFGVILVRPTVTRQPASTPEPLRPIPPAHAGEA